MDEKQELQDSVGNLLEQLSFLNEETTKRRLLADDRFRQETVQRLRQLNDAINGYPASTVSKLDDMRQVLSEQKKHCDAKTNGIHEMLKTISERQNDVLKAKEEMLPSWAKKLLIYLFGAISVVSAAMFTAWWYLSGYAEHLPTILRILNSIDP